MMVSFHVVMEYKKALITSGLMSHDLNRTGDLLITSELLYRLSYVGMILILYYRGVTLSRKM